MYNNLFYVRLELNCLNVHFHCHDTLFVNSLWAFHLSLLPHITTLVNYSNIQLSCPGQPQFSPPWSIEFLVYKHKWLSPFPPSQSLPSPDKLLWLLHLLGEGQLGPVASLLHQPPPPSHDELLWLLHLLGEGQLRPVAPLLHHPPNPPMTSHCNFCISWGEGQLRPVPPLLIPPPMTSYCDFCISWGRGSWGLLRPSSISCSISSTVLGTHVNNSIPSSVIAMSSSILT